MDLRSIAAVNSILFLTVTTPTFLGTVFVQALTLEREVYTREFHGASISCCIVLHSLSLTAPCACSRRVLSSRLLRCG